MRSSALASLLSLAALASGGRAHALVGFYATRSGAGAWSGSSTVVLMRIGDRTVVSMKSDYRGPAERFAWVIPVPSTVARDRVRTLRADALDRIEQLSAPRLVEYWERDPCEAPRSPRLGVRAGIRPPRVTVDARFAERGYPVTVLGAAGLEQWLRERGYRMPDGAEAAVRPYVEAGYRFLIAEVDPAALSFEGGRAVLPPLRFDYREAALSLPIRVGRVGARGPQELVMLVLSPEGRYEVANRDDVLAPSNLVALERARAHFDEVYATIFERVLSRHPGAVVTEYAWPADRCAPCATAALERSDLDTLGRDVLRGSGERRRFVLTRMHARVDDTPESDLVLRAGPPIAGGRGRPHATGNLEHRVARDVEENAFEARYVIEHGWPQPARCASPRPGRWGAPRGRVRPAPITARPGGPTIPLGRMRRYLATWAPVLRIPSRGDALPATAPAETTPPSRRRGRRRSRRSHRAR